MVYIAEARCPRSSSWSSCCRSPGCHLSPDSLENIYEKWAPEVKHFCTDVPIVLVGTKRDLRNDQKTIDLLQRSKQKVITFAEGCKAAEEIGAYGYCECSSRYNEGIREVFEMAIEAAMKPKKSNKFSWNFCPLI